MIQAVFFDLFETLVTEFDPNYGSTPSVADRLGITWDVYAREWIARHDLRNRGTFLNHEAALLDLCQGIGCAVDKDVIRGICEDTIARHERIFSKIDARIVRMLTDIRAIGVKTGLISNATHEEVSAWPTCRLVDLMDTAVFSYKVGLIKPEPEIYQLACRQLGVEPQNCIYVGDGGSNELPGAESAGMRPYCATWFIDRFSESVQASHSRKWNKNYPKLHTPEELVKLVEEDHNV